MTNYYFEIKSKYIIKKNRAENPVFISGEKYSNTCIFALDENMLDNVAHDEYNILVENGNGNTFKYSMDYQKSDEGKPYLVWKVPQDVTLNDGSVQIQIEISGNGYLWKSSTTEIEINSALVATAVEIPQVDMDDYYKKDETDDKISVAKSNILSEVEQNHYSKSETDNKFTENLIDYALKSETDQKANSSDVYTKDELYKKSEIYNKNEVDQLIESIDIPNGNSNDFDENNYYTKSQTDQIMDDYTTLTHLDEVIDPIMGDVDELKQDSIDAFSLIGAISDGLVSDYYTSQTVDKLIGEVSTNINTDDLAKKTDLDAYAPIDSVYNKVSVDLKLATKADSSATYTKTEVDGLIDAIDTGSGGGGAGFMLTSPTGGPKADLTSSTNLNSIFETGIYSFNGAASAPSGGRGILIVISIEAYTLQISYDMLCTRKVRGYMKGVWSGWM